LKTDINVPGYLQKVMSKKTLKKTYFLLASCPPRTKKAGSGSGSVSQWYGSADPDPYQNVTDPQHCLKVRKMKRDRSGVTCGREPASPIQRKVSQRPWKCASFCMTRRKWSSGRIFILFTICGAGGQIMHIFMTVQRK
jgi:hypothetical protein